MVDQNVWNATAAKKKLVTPGESILTKHVMCFDPPEGAGPRQCCVDKSIELDPIVLDASFPSSKLAAVKANGAARLENF